MTCMISMINMINKISPSSVVRWMDFISPLRERGANAFGDELTIGWSEALRFGSAIILLIVSFSSLHAQRIPVLNQIDLPHSYYYRELYLPQLTSGPSSVAWSPDGKSLVFSIAGSLWKQQIGSETADQLTDGNGYDYQPDWSPDGRQIIFVRYDGATVELMVYDLNSKEAIQLTSNKGVNLEPRWSPDGKQIVFVSTVNTGHYLLYKAAVVLNKLSELICLTPDRKSSVKRYYYSAFDHAVNPTWSHDGKKIIFISNKEIAHGTGDIVSINSDGSKPEIIHHEETNWRTKPDMSPDGTRLVYSSYLGRNWHQLWLLPSGGGYPMPITYGDYDNTSPRWSPDGKQIAFISNRLGNTSLWLVNAFDGKQQQVLSRNLNYVNPHTTLALTVQDEKGNVVAARISVVDSKGKFYGSANNWIHADDLRYPSSQQFESHYFHQEGLCAISVPRDKLTIQVNHGPEYEIEKLEVDATQNLAPLVIKLKKLSLPNDFGKWWSGDVHVHMNYGGSYRNTPERLIQQAKAENLNFTYNLIVNKEQRIPDIDYFSTLPDRASTNEFMLLHGQEFHTSVWGHLGLLNLKSNMIIPDYAGYPQTAAASLFPNNKFVADLAHEQEGLVGYVHPFERSEFTPAQSANLINELPVDAALGKVDYYELIGFADHKTSELIWYKLLNCGLHIPAAAGTDAMANYASLRGPVGLNRVYVKAEGPLNPETFQNSVKQGRSFVTNGPLVGLKIEDTRPGGRITINPKGQKLSYTGFLRSAVPVDHVEIVWNGEVVANHTTTATKEVDVKGTLDVKGPGWILLRAWSGAAHPDSPDLYPYSSTNPVYVEVPGMELKSKRDAEFFIPWLNRMEAAAKANTSFRNEEEKTSILADITKAKEFYNNCILKATIK